MTYIGNQICLQSVEETGAPYYTSHLRTPPHSVTTRRHVIPPSNKTDGSISEDRLSFVHSAASTLHSIQRASCIRLHNSTANLIHNAPPIDIIIVYLLF
nr:uncharacterized protein LOC118683882 isoform X2 [Bactrocera oleae]